MNCKRGMNIDEENHKYHIDEENHKYHNSSNEL